jgi:hypothetical protein
LPHEARDFTRWLLLNADVLSDVLGMQLELTEAEHSVGGFSLDLIGRDLATGEVVIVETSSSGPTTLIWDSCSPTPAARTRSTSCGTRRRSTRPTGRHWTG